jgi:hypothetical protein
MCRSTKEHSLDLIDTITVRHQGSERLVMLFAGKLASLPERERVDLLIVSAIPDDYIPTRSSIIGALARVGVSVADLAQDKEVDLRRFSSCWLSRPITQPGVHFHRILCFEPRYRGNAPEVVGDVFRSIVPFTTGSPPISQVAMPLLASGDQGESPEVMLEALTDASVHWLSAGLPLDRVKIVIRDSRSLRETFSRVKSRHAMVSSGPQSPAFSFDVFVSYSHRNKANIDDLVKNLQGRRPSLRVFLDRLELRPGVAWQQHIFESLDQSRKVICALSPDYLASKVCNEEFNIALIRHREATDGVLLPLYLYTSELPTYMKAIQYEDVREGDHAKIAESAERLLQQL